MIHADGASPRGRSAGRERASPHPVVSPCPQNFLNAGSFPEIQGFLQLRGSGRKLWKRFFCFLRRSGLYYSTKGTSKVRSQGASPSPSFPVGTPRPSSSRPWTLSCSSFPSKLAVSCSQPPPPCSAYLPQEVTVEKADVPEFKSGFASTCCVTSGASLSLSDPEILPGLGTVTGRWDLPVPSSAYFMLRIQGTYNMWQMCMSPMSMW